MTVTAVASHNSTPDETTRSLGSTNYASKPRTWHGYIVCLLGRLLLVAPRCSAPFQGILPDEFPLDIPNEKRAQFLVRLNNREGGD